MKNVKTYQQFLNENDIKKEYQNLKKLSKKELETKWSISYKIGTPKELDKEGLISDILRSKHGNKKVDQAFEQFLNENKKMNVVELTFRNTADFREAIKILTKNNFKPNTSIDKGAGYYEQDEHWKTVRFSVELESEIIPLLKNYQLEYKNPRGYKVFNHGGHLD